MDFLFRLAICLLPFENLFFAPSNGWATISPIILFFYVVFNLKEKIIPKKILLLMALVICLSMINFLFVGYNTSAVADTLITIIMGFCTLLALNIYFIKRKNDINKIVKIILISYTISLIIGWIQFFTIKFNISALYNFFKIVSKRNYLEINRVQFTFTEPSFIGMHLFGVLLPIYFATKNKKILVLIIAFSLTELFFGSSVRFLIDLAIIILIILCVYLTKQKKYVQILAFLCLFIVGVTWVYNTNTRVRRIINDGVYADNSLASRYYRIQASCYGYSSNVINFITGYGIGNAILPIREGYDRAFSQFKATYLKEVETLGQDDYYDSSASFCLFIRLISEYGIIVFGFLAFYMYKMYKKSTFNMKEELMLIFIYLYIQFDSYAFYTLWILIFILNNSKNNIAFIEKRGKNEKIK